MTCPKCHENEAHFVPPSLGDLGFYTCEYTMSHNKSRQMQHAVRLLNDIFTIDADDREALPGAALKHIKSAKKLLLAHIRKRRDALKREMYKHASDAGTDFRAQKIVDVSGGDGATERSEAMKAEHRAYSKADLKAFRPPEVKVFDKDGKVLRPET